MLRAWERGFVKVEHVESRGGRTELRELIRKLCSLLVAPGRFIYTAWGFVRFVTTNLDGLIFIFTSERCQKQSEILLICYFIPSHHVKISFSL